MLALQISSNKANKESIPKLTIMIKNIKAHKFEKGIKLKAAGNIINVRSGPAKANSVMSQLY